MISRKKRRSLSSRVKSLKRKRLVKTVNGIKRNAKRLTIIKRRKGFTGRITRRASYNKAYNMGFDEAYNEGYNVGYAEGIENGQQVAYKGE